MKILTIIPARMSSSRLPGKPLALIAGDPMIVHVWRRAKEADIGPVIVAAAETEIIEAIASVGGDAILTRPDHPSGTDRVFEALMAFDSAGEFDGIVNLQGDLPTLNPEVIVKLGRRVEARTADIVTLAAEIVDDGERNDPNVVKAVLSFHQNDAEKWAHALYFTRAAAPSGEGPLYHHIGLYGYQRSALGRFVELAPSPLEMRERLEQLRALEAGMSVEVGLVDSVPVGVDTPADLARARMVLEPSK